MRKIAKLALVVIFGIAYLTACGGTTPTPKPKYSLDGIYALDYEISEVQGPADFTLDDIEKKKIAWEFSTDERELTFVTQYEPDDFDSENVNKSVNITNNKGTLTDTFTSSSNNDYQITYTIDINMTSNDSFSFEELREIKNTADPSENRSFKFIGTGTKETLYEIADGTYEYKITVVEERFNNIEVGDELDEKLTFSGNTVSKDAFFSDKTLTSQIKYNRAVLVEKRDSDNVVCALFLTLTSDTTFESITICENDDDELLLDAGATVTITP